MEHSLHLRLVNGTAERAGRFLRQDAVPKRYTGRASKVGKFASIESFACNCCGKPLFDQQLIRMGLAVVELVRAFRSPR